MRKKYNPITFVKYILPFLLIILTAPQTFAAKAADLVTDGQPVNLNQEKFHNLFRELTTKHHFSKSELDKIFQGVQINKKVLELMDKPWEAKPYHQYAPLFLNKKRIIAGREMLKKHKKILDRIEKEIGVDREIIIAIWGIETRYGANQGSYNVLRTLTTLFAAYPRRSQFFGKELKEFLLLCKENEIDPKTINGSYAGAFGQTQFIPSSFRAYALSFDGDAKRDVWNSVPDILASIAHYLKKHKWTLNSPLYWDLGNELRDKLLVKAYHEGWRGRVDWQNVHDRQAPGIPPSPGNRQLSIVGLKMHGGSDEIRYFAGYPNFQAVTHWNHSNRYAMAAAQLAEAISHEPGK